MDLWTELVTHQVTSCCSQEQVAALLLHKQRVAEAGRTPSAPIAHAGQVSWQMQEAHTENHIMVWVGRDLKDHLLPAPLPWAGTPCTRPGCSELHPTWPGTLPGRGIREMEFTQKYTLKRNYNSFTDFTVSLFRGFT